MNPLAYHNASGSWNQRTLQFLILCELFELSYEPSTSASNTDFSVPGDVGIGPDLTKAVACLLRECRMAGQKTPETLEELLAGSLRSWSQPDVDQDWCKDLTMMSHRLNNPYDAASYLQHLSTRNDTFLSLIQEYCASFDRLERAFSALNKLGSWKLDFQYGHSVWYTHRISAPGAYGIPLFELVSRFPLGRDNMAWELPVGFAAYVFLVSTLHRASKVERVTPSSDKSLVAYALWRSGADLEDLASLAIAVVSDK